MRTTNQEKLQSIVKGHTGNKQFLEEFLHFHASVKQKLWSVEHFSTRIAELQPTGVWQPIAQPNTLTTQWSIDIKEFGLTANLVLDCFLMNAMAVLDTLAHEIGVLYCFQSVQQKPSNKMNKVYIRTVKDDLMKCHSNKHLTKYLASELAKSWFSTFAGYRHCTTHESLISSTVLLNVSTITGDLSQAVVPLPDDPRKRPFAYKQGRELKSYCNKTREDIKQMVSHCYYHIVKDIKLANSILPVP